MGGAASCLNPTVKRVADGKVTGEPAARHTTAHASEPKACKVDNVRSDAHAVAIVSELQDGGSSLKEEELESSGRPLARAGVSIDLQRARFGREPSSSIECDYI